MIQEEQLELHNLHLVLSDQFILQRIPDNTLTFIIKRYDELVDKLLNKYKLLADAVKDPLPD